MKILFISDTHGYHDQLIIPDGIDMIIHSGDEANSANPINNSVESTYFFNWYEQVPVKHKIFVPGNHSTAIKYGLIRPESFPNIKFLINEEVTIEGIRIYGSPYTPSYGNSWAYMQSRHKMFQIWELIPDGIDILITHGMPKSILDLTRDKDTNNLVQVGCKSLYNKVLQIKPKIFCGGHLHSEDGINNFGIYENFGIKFINAACLNHQTNEFYNGHVVDF